MVGMHAGQVTHRVPHIELNHADDTPVDIVITLDVKQRLTLCSSCSRQRCQWASAG